MYLIDGAENWRVQFESRFAKGVAFLAVAQIYFVLILSFLPNSDLMAALSLSMIAFDNFMAAIYCFLRMSSAQKTQKLGWLFVGLCTSGIFVNGMENLLVDSSELVSPVSVTILSMVLGLGVFLILWDYLSSHSRKRLLVDTIYLTLIMLLSLFYTAFLPFYRLDSASKVEIVSILTLLCFVCVAVSLGIAIMSQSSHHRNLFIALPLIAIALVLSSTSQLLWIQLNSHEYKYFGFVDIGFHLAFSALMVLPHITRPKIDVDNIQPLNGIKSVTFGPIFLSAPILFLFAPVEARLVISVGAVLLAVMAFKVVAVDKENRDLNKKILKITETDYLTGALNRRGLQSYLSQLDDLSNLYLIYIDLDEFKQINDIYGHDNGDLLLNEVTNSLRESLRSTDKVVRIGGDEFIALVNGVNESNLELIIAKIEAIGNRSYEIEGDSVTVGLTAAIVKGNEEIDAQELIRSADQLMLANKKSNKGTVKKLNSSHT